MAQGPSQADGTTRRRPRSTERPNPGPPRVFGGHRCRSRLEPSMRPGKRPPRHRAPSDLLDPACRSTPPAPGIAATCTDVVRLRIRSAHARVRSLEPVKPSSTVRGRAAGSRLDRQRYRVRPANKRLPTPLSIETSVTRIITRLRTIISIRRRAAETSYEVLDTQQVAGPVTSRSSTESAGSRSSDLASSVADG